jgi:hypothetical protein
MWTHRDRMYDRRIDSGGRGYASTAFGVLTDQPTVEQRVVWYLASTHDLGEGYVVASGDGLEPRIKCFPLDGFDHEWERSTTDWRYRRLPVPRAGGRAMR